MTERTLCIFKPDLAAKPSNVANALIRLLGLGLVPSHLERLTLTQTQAQALYVAHVGQPYHQRNLEFMTSGPCVVMVLEGEFAVDRLRMTIGPTDPQKADPYHLRSVFGSELPRNAFHASATAREAESEIRIFFGGP